MVVVLIDRSGSWDNFWVVLHYEVVVVVVVVDVLVWCGGGVDLVVGFGCVCSG